MISKFIRVKHSALAGVLMLFVIFFAVTISADDHENARKLMESGTILPLETIIDRLQKITKGKVIEVELEHKDDRMVYEIHQVDEHGVVREFYFDAQSGHLLKEELED